MKGIVWLRQNTENYIPNPAPDPVFIHNSDSGSGKKRKRRRDPESTPALRLRNHLWSAGGL